MIEAGIRHSRSHPPFVQATALSMSSHVAVLHRDTAVAAERATAALDLADRWRVRGLRHLPATTATHSSRYSRVPAPSAS